VSKPKSSPGWVLTAGAALFAVYVFTHPRGAARDASTVDEAVHSMAVEGAWVTSHVVGLAAVVLIGTGVWMLLRDG
jgi:formate/nitrite transporter FocA (FNT family)